MELILLKRYQISGYYDSSNKMNELSLFINKIMRPSSRSNLKNPELFQTINQSPTNNSKSKHTYGFSKTPRFIVQSTICPQGTYGGETIRTKNRGAAIGYGKKSDFTKVLTSSPGSSKYHLKSNFQFSRQKLKGHRMADGRDKIVYRSYVDRVLCTTPSADRYITTFGTKPKSPAYSMRTRTKIHNRSMTIEAQNSNPGPGQYSNPEIDRPKSRFSNSRYPRISYGTNKEKRFSNPDNKVPGPAGYLEVSSFSNVGKYIVSSHRGGTQAKFDKTKRITKFDEAKIKSRENPGPGAYRAPSEFGQYDGNISQSFATLKAR